MSFMNLKNFLNFNYQSNLDLLNCKYIIVNNKNNYIYTIFNFTADKYIILAHSETGYKSKYYIYNKEKIENELLIQKLINNIYIIKGIANFKLILNRFSIQINNEWFGKKLNTHTKQSISNAANIYFNEYLNKYYFVDIQFQKILFKSINVDFLNADIGIHMEFVSLNETTNLKLNYNLCC